ncbi:hypothetical protein [Xenorhabdus sp. IM139775]|uniref:hypothetical protein n=1 Tax=Xenorhabdus sp. IM139775 TaxID=3025876 RepID=UPI002359E1E5|nr:hypothetical protein [Xenorhabdus sp. IM139775]MDC9594934.1 hypothetical protein [Xenorhabdus sp. IM139775]
MNQLKKTGYFKNHCQKKNQLTGSLWNSLLFFLFLMTIKTASGKSNMEYKYLVSFNTQRSLCVLKVNGMLMLENTSSRTGTESSGYNISAFLENGYNTLELLMGRIPADRDTDKFHPESWCEATIRKLSSHDEKGEMISNIKLNVDDNGNVVTKNSINSNEKFDYANISMKKGEKNIFAAQKTFSVNNLPNWIWTKATPVTENDLPSIKAIYQEISNTFSSRNLDKIWKMSQPAWEEWAIADNSSAKIFFDSMGFEEDISGNSVIKEPDWDKYKLVSYKNGRLFRLEKGVRGSSPIIFHNKKNGGDTTYSPYLSIINGKIVIAR